MVKVEFDNVVGDLRLSQTIEASSEELSIVLPSQTTELRRAGRQIDYVQVKLSEYTPEQRLGLARYLHELEKPVFESVYGADTADPKEEIKPILDLPETILLMALDRKEGTGQPQAVGYLLGLPASAYVGFQSGELTDDNGKALKLPEKDTYYLHAIGVAPESRNRKVGYNLWNIFRQEIFPPFSKWKGLALFAALRPTDKKSYMLQLLERELNLPQLRQEGRVSEGDITKYRDEDGTWQDRLVAVHYLFIDLRGKFETALMAALESRLANL